MSPDIKKLLESLKSPLEAQRERAVSALLQHNDIRAIAALQEVAASDGSVRIRYLAKKALFVLKRRTAKDIADDGAESLMGLKASTLNPDKVKAVFNADHTRKKLNLLKVIARNKLVSTFPVLVDAAKSEKDPTVRSNILIVLGMLGDEDHVMTIASFLNDPDYRVRANAIEALEYMNTPNAYPIIVNALADTDNRIKANAIKALKNYGKINVVNLLRKMLKSDQEWMRDSAAYALSMVAKNEALTLLLESLSDPHPTIRKRAREGLSNLARRGNATAAEAMKELEKASSGEEDAPEPVDLTHLIEQASFRDESDNLLKSPDSHVRLKELRSIVEGRDTTRILDIVEMAQTDSDEFIKANAVAALGKLGDENLVNTIAEFLSSPIDRVRANAIEALSSIGGDEITPLLIPRLDDKNNRCKANAVIALKNHPYISIIKPLKEMVESDNVLMRKSAFYAITDIASDDVLPLLEVLFHDPDAEIAKNTRHFLQMAADQGSSLAKSILLKLSSSDNPANIESLTGDFFSSAGIALAVNILESDSQSELLAPPPDEALEEKDDDTAEVNALPARAQSCNEPLDEKPFRYSIEQFSSQSKKKKRAIIEELKNEITVQAYLFLRDVLNDQDFEIKCLAKVALKNFENEDFASIEHPKESDRGWVFANPTIETVEYQGFKKTIQLSRDLNEKSQKFEYQQTWNGPFPPEFPVLNALREDTQEMLQFILKDEEIRKVTICFQHDRLKPFIEGRRSLDGNRFAHVIALSSVINRLDPYVPSAKLLKSIKRPIYLIAVFTDHRLILFLRGPLETSFAKYLAINYQQIDTAEVVHAQNNLETLVLHINNDYVEIPELYSHEMASVQESVTNWCLENLKKEHESGRFNPEAELQRLETLLKAGAINRREYRRRKARIQKLLALSGVHGKKEFAQALQKVKNQAKE